eukprot:GHVU01176410.1.p1 GENE.GHVU01176410.1~~GHVU01176410.1.p1  ORF type:complete len:120 (+),score=13.00 GHVU01176410.1:492-851(+)
MTDPQPPKHWLSSARAWGEREVRREQLAPAAELTIDSVKQAPDDGGIDRHDCVTAVDLSASKQFVPVQRPFVVTTVTEIEARGSTEREGAMPTEEDKSSAAADASPYLSRCVRCMRWYH